MEEFVVADTSQIWVKIYNMQKAFLASLPNLVLALIVFGIFLFAGRSARKLIHHFVSKQKSHQNLTLVLERLIYGIIVMVGLFVSLSIIIPSFKASDLIQILGIGGVAFGFAFKDILQNFLSGILILLTDPFKIGDAISVKGFEGVVEDIQTRATFIKTWDGQRIVIPNTELFINPVTVQTAYDLIRKDFTVKIPRTDDAGRAAKVITERLKTIPEIAKTPAPAVYLNELQETGTLLKAYFWFDQKKNSTYQTIHLAMTSANEALAENKISTLPLAQTVVLSPPKKPESAAHNFLNNGPKGN